MRSATGAAQTLLPDRTRGRDWARAPQTVVLLCALSIVPLLMIGFPPLVDLYGHLGRYAIQTDLHNRPELQPYFSFQWRLIGNLGADLLVEALHAWVGLEQSVRIVTILTQLLAAAGVLWVSLEVHRRITPFAIAALPLIYGYPFNYGFINFSLAMALALIAFAGWLRLRRTSGPASATLWLLGAGVVCWISHTYGWAFLGLLCGSAALSEAFAAARRSPAVIVRRVLAECWPLLLPAVGMILWRGGVTNSATGEWALTFKALWLVSTMRIRWMLVDVGSIIALVLLGYWAVRSQKCRLDPRLALAAVLCFACFAALPMRVFGSAFADMRLMPYLIICALLAIVPDGLSDRALRWATLFALAFFLGRMGVTTYAYVQEDRAAGDALATIEAIPPGARVAFFAIEPCRFSWKPSIYSHLGGALIARRNAFANDQWQADGLNPLVVHYPEAGVFARDPAQLVLRDDCPNTHYPRLSQSLARLPLAAFTHVWIVGEERKDLIAPAGLRPLPHRGSGQLFAVEPRVDPAR